MNISESTYFKRHLENESFCVDWLLCVHDFFYIGFCSAFLIKNFCILPLALDSGKLNTWLMWRVGPSAVLLS